MLPLTRSEIAAIEATFIESLAPAARQPRKSAEPFAKRAEGMNRRMERRRRLADKHSYINQHS